MPAAARPRPLVAFVPFLLVGVVHLAGQLMLSPVLTTLTKPFLIPLLAFAVIWLLRRSLSRATILLLGALLFSWLGDLALLVPGDTWFLLGLVLFLLAHVAYIALFSSEVGAGRPRRWSAVYGGWFAALILVLAPHLGEMLVPVVVYGAVICSMAVVATRCGATVVAGATLFLLSDSLLAVNMFVADIEIPAVDFLVMLTYLAGQGLIALGIVRLVVPADEPLVAGGVR